MNSSTLLFGATSILGYNLARRFESAILPFVTPGRNPPSVRHWPQLQLEETQWIANLLDGTPPKILLYCHAVCDVPKCEAAPDWADEINVQHVKRVLECLPEQTKFIYVSSDHVFSGDGIYDENSPPCPISVYGRTRVAAEELALQRSGSLIIRVGLPIGPSPNGRTGHWDWLCYRIARNLPVTIVDDEYRSVVWADDLAQRVMALAESPAIGIRHITATRVLSRVELAHFVMAENKFDAQLFYESRHERTAPHLGHVELATTHRCEIMKPLPSVIDTQGEPADIRYA